MNFKWFRNKLTFVIIPEANGSVVRVNLSRGLIGGALLLAVLLIGASGFIYFRHLHSTASAYLRTSELNGRTARLEQDLKGKNAAIEQLQNELHSLSKQAEQVHSKMEEMKRLEQELKKLAPGSAPASGSSGGTSAVSAAAGSGAAGGMGGPAIPVTAKEMQELANLTEARYQELEQEMNRLQGHFTRSKQLLLEKLDRQRRTPSLWPTVSKIVTSPYGYRKDPFTKKLSFHRGIDIAGKMNDPVYAAAGGTVREVGYDKLHGHNVILEHADGLRTWYMHLSSASVRKGQTVDKGQQIGKLGTTGRSTGPHLHYEIQTGGKSTDPAPYLPASYRKEKG
ncbi:peptidoglycan DD-metalloendopeptidase family protein [Paenibacillus sp. S-38]|uniref:peptidoglycan DD-metalloendopeptidase family protein n=1 Tax=Paenibacillus sp. S-38 TaxID=3416710 RepID=UPI003CEDD39A